MMTTDQLLRAPDAVEIGEPAAPFRRRHHATVNALWIGIQFQDAALMAIIVPAIVLLVDPRHHTSTLALLATIAAAVATLVPPLAGMISDRGRRRGHDRRVETAYALGVDVLALLGMAVANSATTLAISVALAALAISVASTVYQALLPEVVPRHAWGISSGVRGALTLVGTIVGLLVAALLHPKWALVATATIVALGAITLAAIPDKPIDNQLEPEHPDIPRDRHDLLVTMIARGLLVLGMGLLNTYILYFFHDVMHVSNAPLRTGITATGALGGAILSSIIAGAISDRVDRRYVVVAAGIPMTLAGLGFAFAPTPSALVWYAALFGFGFGGVFSVGWALALESIPEMGDVGRDLGTWSTLSGLPAIAAPALGAFLIAHGATPTDGYRLMFAVASLCFAAGSLTVLQVRKRRKPSAAAR
jgi:MFS family permease